MIKRPKRIRFSSRALLIAHAVSAVLVVWLYLPTHQANRTLDSLRSTHDDDLVSCTVDRVTIVDLLLARRTVRASIKMTHDMPPIPGGGGPYEDIVYQCSPNSAIIISKEQKWDWSKWSIPTHI
jgi:hypothetical protein